MVDTSGNAHGIFFKMPESRKRLAGIQQPDPRPFQFAQILPGKVPHAGKMRHEIEYDALRLQKLHGMPAQPGDYGAAGDHGAFLRLRGPAVRGHPGDRQHEINQGQTDDQGILLGNDVRRSLLI